MKHLNYLLVVLAATLYLGCTPPERVDNGGNNSDDIENNGGSENNGGGGGNDGNGNNGGAENTSKPTTSAPYEVGDYYNESGKEGIVIEVDQDGNNGKIISLRQSPTPLQWASDVAEQNRLVGTIYMSGGVENLAKIVKIPNWKEKYPAFKWCFDYGKGWYLPALQEVESFSTHIDVINSALSAAGGTPIGGYAYWSSTEDSASAENGEYKAHYVNVNTKTSLSNQKKYKFYVRAVASFGDWYDEIYNDIYQEIYDNPNDDDNGDDDNGGGSGGGDDDNNGDGDDDNNDGGGGNNPNDPITVINGIEMVGVHGGTFTMGSDDAEALDTERPAHSVTVSNYFIGKYEVTQALWVAVMGSNPSGFRGDDNLPVENISWNMAMEFITKLNAITGKRYRMPTEAEWELAAREALLTQKYPYSGSYNVDEVAWYCDNAENMTHPVGQKKPNPRGIYDMSGNVFELCYDWFGMYSTAHQTNPIGPSSGTFRIMRGGSYVDNAFGCRIIYRNGLDSQDTRYINVGLRLAMSADSTGPDYNDRGDWLGPDFYNPINPNPDPDDPDPDNPTPTPNPDDLTSPPYKVGDYYNENGLTGTVFYVTDNGYSGKIINKSVGECAWATGSTLTELVGTNSQTNGRRNMDIITAIKDWQSRYPAFKWCADLGEDWYLPALNELYEIVKHRDILGLGQYYGWASFWSSTEVNKIEYGDFGCILETDAYIVPVAPEPPLMYSDKSSVLYVFAVASFGRDVDIGKNDDTIGDDNNGGIGGGVTTYYIGKLVEVDGVQGIVYQISPCVKIFSVQQTMTQWSVESEVGESTGEMDKYDGAKNMAVLKARGLDKYPAAKWCADLGDGWYLPAVYELEDVFYQAAVFDEVLSANGFDIFGWNDYWTSTSDPLYALIVDFPYGGMWYDFKNKTFSVRAVRVMK